MRRRLRRQQRVREALLLDLGALVFELHRQNRREPELLQAKAAELTEVDREVRALADALHEDGAMPELVAPGIAGSCEFCGALLTTDARFCSRCGVPTEPATGEYALEAEEAHPGVGAREEAAQAAELEASEEPPAKPEEPAAAEKAPEAAEKPAAEKAPAGAAEKAAAEPKEPRGAPRTRRDLAEQARRAVEEGVRRGRRWLARRGAG